MILIIIAFEPTEQNTNKTPQNNIWITKETLSKWTVKERFQYGDW